MSDAQSCKNLVDFTLKTYGTIDILDCNAGICTLSDFLTSDDVWRDAQTPHMPFRRLPMPCPWDA